MFFNILMAKTVQYELSRRLDCKAGQPEDGPMPGDLVIDFMTARPQLPSH